MRTHFMAAIWLATSFMAWSVLTVQCATFVASTNAVGAGPISVAATDFNGDGRFDLISANNNASTLTLLTNNGSGGFGSNALVNVGSHPICVIAADVNGDGQPDLISVNNTDNTLTVLTNNGGGFVVSATLSVGFSPVSVAAADVNGNGSLDLISANSFANTLTVLTNNGGGKFGSNATLNVGSHPYCVAVADINGDNKPDLISANYNDSTLTVLTNNGSGVFGSNATLAVGSNPTCVVAADINSDGRLDLISANYGDGTLTIWTNSGGSFGLNTNLTVSGFPYAVVVTDINGDGKPDLAAADSGVYPGNGNLMVLTNNGSGVFGSNTLVNVGLQPFSVVSADFNGDGWMDLATANFGDDTMTILTQTPSLPILSIAMTSSNTVLVSWPLPQANGFVLQTNSDLTATNWVQADFPVWTNGGTGSSSVTPEGSQLYFRLKK